MVSKPGILENVDLHKVQQVVKWIVYSILIVNFGYYIYEDTARVFHTLTPESTILDWTENFANSIDLLAWFTLLGLLELETYGESILPVVAFGTSMIRRDVCSSILSR